MDKVYNGGFSPEFSVSLLKEFIALVRDIQTHDLVLTNHAHTVTVKLSGETMRYA